MFRSIRAMALVVVGGVACAGTCSSLAADANIRSPLGDPTLRFDAVPTASLDDLAALRGGLRVGALDVAFAANVRTVVNGTLVLESTTSLTPGGAMVTRSDVPNAGANTGRLSFSDVNPSGLARQAGVFIEDPSGLTTALHSVTREQILGVVFTTASNQKIRQEINVEVTVANFGRFQDAAQSALFNGRLIGSFGSVN